jgi:hypothetical protein
MELRVIYIIMQCVIGLISLGFSYVPKINRLKKLNRYYVKGFCLSPNLSTIQLKKEELYLKNGRQKFMII